MSGLRTIKTARIRSIARHRDYRFDPIPDGSAGNDFLHIVVLDDRHNTAERIQDALWVWPHKVVNASSISEVVKICHISQPTAVIASIDFSDSHDESAITTLRLRLPKVPIIAVGPGTAGITPANIIGQDADAFVLHEDLHRPVLHDLLLRVQQSPRAAFVTQIPPLPKMLLAWRQSRISGALICDISGNIIDANHCLSRWLGYPGPESLLGRYLCADLLVSGVDWSAWKKIAGDTSAFIHQSIELATKNGQNLRLKVEVFAAPSLPSHLQAVFAPATGLPCPRQGNAGH